MKADARVDQYIAKARAILTEVRARVRRVAYTPDDTAATLKLLEYLTALGEMTGWARSLYRHRAECHERLGNVSRLEKGGCRDAARLAETFVAEPGANARPATSVS